MYEHIQFQVDDPVAVITLDRPEAMNAWTGRMEREFRDAVARAEADPAVVGIVITGAGRAFCAGADMKTLQGLSSGGGDAGITSTEAGSLAGEGEFDGKFSFLMALRKPVIAAINGAVAGMAFPLVLACDLRFMAEDAVMLTAFAHRGLVAEWGLGFTLPKLVGTGVALDLLFSSRRVTGAEAAQLGLVNRAVPAAELMATALAYVQDLAAKGSPASYAVMKRQVYTHMMRGLAQSEQEAEQLMKESFERPDFAEGVRSFVEKRPPSFPRIGTT